MTAASQALTDSADDQQSGGSHLDEAVQSCDFPILVWELPDGIVRLANQPAADLLGVAVGALVGRRIIEMVTPRHFVEVTQAAIGAMAVDSVQADRWLKRPDGGSTAVRVWSRAVQVNGLRCAIGLIVPLSEIGRLGRDPATPWRDLAPIAVGIVDKRWRIERISSDIRNISGMEASEYAGVSLLAMLHPDDAALMADAINTPASTVVACNRMRLRRRDGTWTQFCLLLGPLGEDRKDRSAFAVITGPSPDPLWFEGRVSELERRLRHIGSEVRASGVLDVMDSLPTASDSPHMSELSSRQWDILSRLARGDRVSTIATDLFLSRSTIRNHLSVIFRKFGVHSQAELLQAVRRGTSDGQTGA
jgi:DNA-binding CsgD family transcriptional regulator/PAS domain-containing protein